MNEASAPPRVERLVRHADFLAANRGRRVVTPGFILLVRNRRDDNVAIRVGLTVSRKVGNAVIRNRVKRRLRALTWEVLPIRGAPGSDHVFIARPGAEARAFADLHADLFSALAKAAR